MTAVPKAESIATAEGRAPTVIGGFGAGGIEDADGGTATLNDENDGAPPLTSLFCISMGNKPGVARSEPDKVTVNWRLF